MRPGDLVLGAILLTLPACQGPGAAGHHVLRGPEAQQAIEARGEEGRVVGMSYTRGPDIVIWREYPDGARSMVKGTFFGELTEFEFTPAGPEKREPPQSRVPGRDSTSN